jgi:hypothetical protein
LDANDVSLENLDALFAGLDNAYVHFDFVAWQEVGNVITLVLIINDVCALHGAPSNWNVDGQSALRPFRREH